MIKFFEMKLIILLSLKGALSRKFGNGVWYDILGRSGFRRDSVVLHSLDVPDEVFLKILEVSCSVTGLTAEQIFDLFAEYWVFEFSQRTHGKLYSKCRSAREFLVEMDHVHVQATRDIPGARPPRFEYEWKDSKTLIMKYKSHRNMIDLMISLIRAVGRFYNEELQIEKLNDHEVMIRFP